MCKNFNQRNQRFDLRKIENINFNVQSSTQICVI